MNHRVIGKDDSGNLITKGDANKTQDLSPVPEDQIVSTYLWHVPLLGYFMRSFGGKGPAAAAACIVTMRLRYLEKSWKCLKQAIFQHLGVITKPSLETGNGRHIYVGKKVDVKITKDAITVYYKGTAVASHKRLYGRRNQYSTLEIHMPENHQLYQWNADRFLNWAKSIGPNTYQVVDKHIHRYSVEEQSYKGCISILKLSDKYTAERLENACQLALSHIPNPTYKNIRLILEARQDEAEIHQKELNESDEHALVRGSAYYGGKRS